MTGKAFEKALARAREAARKKTSLVIEQPDGTEKVVSKFDPPSRSLFEQMRDAADPKVRKRGRK